MSTSRMPRRTSRDGGVGILAVFLIAIGAAAAVYVWLYNMWNTALAWENPQMAQLETRGDGVAPAYKPEDMMAFFSVLQESIEENYGKQVTPAEKKSWFGPKKTQWTMRIRMQELVDGSLVIQVEADSKDSKLMKREWALKFSSPDDFQKKINGYGGTIATELASTAPDRGAAR